MGILGLGLIVLSILMAAATPLIGQLVIGPAPAVQQLHPAPQRGMPWWGGGAPGPDQGGGQPG